MTAASWDEEFDVVVIGFGGAGACAAIEAAGSGARVLIAERFTGGGATKKSGGVIYSGGGTAAQKAAGFRDTPEKMYRYLARETGAGADAQTLRAFCASSSGSLKWLETIGILIPDRYFEGKTTQPPGGYGLYFSGNEKQYTGDDPAPRGHVPDGTGMSGGALYRALAREALKRGAEARYRSRPRGLIIESGSVTGVELLTLSASPAVRLLHSLLFSLGYASGACRSLLPRLEEAFGTVSRVRARGGVVISAGGFIYNRRMMAAHAPAYAGCMPLGTPGDDGAGIVLGMSAGGTVDSMSACAASRFFCPPEAFVSGILVNRDGKRFCDESLYGATLSRHISEQPEKKAWLVIDAKLHRTAGEQMKTEERLRDASPARILSGEMNALIFRKAMAFVNRRVNRVKARSIAALEARCGMPAGSLGGTIERYNRDCAGGGKDEWGKAKQYLQPIGEAPFYAVNCRLDSRLFPSPCLTLGGLTVDGLTSRVRDENGSPVPGLYAAGRSAAGVCSRSYVSGLSLADCVFSGRNAGKNAAEAGRESLRKSKRK